MSQAIKTKTTKVQTKLKVLLKVEKRFNGLAITVNCKDFGEFIGEFFTRYNKDRNKSFDYLPNPHTIITSINWNDNFNSNRLINNKYINLTIFRKFMLLPNDNEQTFLINNVFTNDEIKTYIETFESIVIKMRSLMNEKKPRKIKPKVVNIPTKINKTLTYNIDSVNACGRDDCPLCNSQRLEQRLDDLRMGVV